MNSQNQKEHYVCLGGCEGVSTVPGVCQAEHCEAHGQNLTPCNCTDGSHHDFEPEDVADDTADLLD